MNEIVSPADGTQFSFFGEEGRLVLPKEISSSEVLLRYETEPPHGDFLYSITIGSRAVGAGSRPRLFWGRNIAVSPCGSYLAVTEFSPTPKIAHSVVVIDLLKLKEWKRAGWFHVCSISTRNLTVQPWIVNDGRVTYGAEELVDLGIESEWGPLHLMERPPPNSVGWYPPQA